MTAFGKLVFGSIFLVIGSVSYMIYMKPRVVSPSVTVESSTTQRIDITTSETSSTSTKEEFVDDSHGTSTVLFSEYLKHNKNQICKVSLSGVGEYKEGVISFNDARIKGNFSSGSASSSFFIIVNKKIYSWVDGDTQGRVSKNNLSTSVSDGIFSSFDIKSVSSYVCSAASLEGKDFSLPLSVTFETKE